MLNTLRYFNLELVIWPLKMGVLSEDKIQRTFPLIGLIAVLLAQSEYTVDRVLCAKLLAASLSLGGIWLILSYAGNRTRNAVIQLPYAALFFLLYLLISLPSFHHHPGADQWFEWNKRLLQLCSMLLLFVWFSRYKPDSQQLIRGGFFFSISLATLGSIAFLPLLKEQAITHAATYLFTSSFAHRNIFAEILLLSIPFAIAYFLSAEKYRIAGIFVSILILLFILIAMSRAVWISFAAAWFLVIASIWMIRPPQNSDQSPPVLKKKRLVLILSILLAAAAAVLIILRFSGTEDFVKQLQSIFSTSYGSGNERIQLWKKSFSVFKENPVLGSGLGSWKIEVLKYGHSGLVTEDNLTFHQRPHNDYLWIACESGSIGLLFYTLWLGSLVYGSCMQIKYARNLQSLFFFRAILFSLISYLFFSFFSFPSERIEHGFILSLFSGLIFSGDHKIALSPIKISSRYLLLLLLLPLVIASFSGYRRYNAEIELAKAYRYRSIGDWHGLIQSIQRSEDNGMHIDPMCTPLRWYSGSGWYNLGDQKMALNDFKLAYQINPNHVHVLNNIGTAEMLAGNADSAIIFYEKALRIAPGFKDASLNLAAAFFNTKNSSDAMRKLIAMESDSSDQRYLQTVRAVSRAEILRLKDSVDCHDLSLRIEAFANVKSWPEELFFKAKKERRSFPAQVLLDAIFILDSGEVKNNILYLNKISRKYNLKKTP